MNALYLYASHHTAEPMISLGIGTCQNRRRVRLTEDEALKLAYRLMSLARGGETRGMERFPPVEG